jgi:DNA mismatch repair protein MutS2
VSRSAQELLEFDKLRAILRRSTTCAPGRRAVETLDPRSDRIVLEREFTLVREAIAYLRSGAELGFGALADPAPWLERLPVPGTSLSSAELLDAASLMETVASLKQTFRGEAAKYPRLAERAAALGDFRSQAAAIRHAILPNGEISDNASRELARIRATQTQARETVQHTLERILRARGEEPGQDYVTLRNDRFVIPVRAADRRAVPGVVHGASATGQTVFIEPLEALEWNNRLVQLAEDEAAEIARILEELTERLRIERGPLEAAAATIAELDSIFARARFAREFDCAIPEFTVGNTLRLSEARHPVLEDNLRKQGRPIVPITLELGGEEIGDSGLAGTVMVISGPNTGGKTVALKTVGLAALAAQSGIPVAAQKAELPLFDHVLADIGDEQSITADLSTFSAHMLNLRAMLEAATERSLVLVDEMGTGTAPEEGAALAVALLEEFRTRRALTIATTHHDRLKSYASTTPGIVNAAVEFDSVNLRPTYRLLVGVPGVSSGIEIAQRLGLPADVIARARAGLSPETREAQQLIAYLHRSRDEVEEIKRQEREELARLEAERRSLQTEWVERQRKRLAELEKKFAETIKQLEAQVARFTAEISDKRERAQLEKLAARRLSKIGGEAREDTNAVMLEHLAASQSDLGVTAELPAQAVEPEILVPGARVRVRGMKQPVIIRSVEGRNAEVQAGPLRMKVPLNDIVGLEEDAAAPGPAAGGTGVSRNSAAKEAGVAPAARPRGITVHAQPSEEPAADEINVIGTTVEEATRRVDKFLNDATLANLPRLRIIHGYGTGALRRGLAAFLSSHPLVEKIHAETSERGGEAITVVDLRS